MAGEQHAIEIEGLALIPVGGGEHRDDARHRRVFVGLDLHADAMVLVGRQQMIDDIEALRARGIVGAANIDEADKTAFRIVAQEAQNLDDLRGLRADRQFAEGYGMSRNRSAQALPRYGRPVQSGFQP